MPRIPEKVNAYRVEAIKGATETIRRNNGNLPEPPKFRKPEEPGKPFIEYFVAEERLKTLPKKLDELKLELKKPYVDKRSIEEQISSVTRQILVDKAYVQEHSEPGKVINIVI